MVKNTVMLVGRGGVPETSMNMPLKGKRIEFADQNTQKKIGTCIIYMITIPRSIIIIVVIRTRHWISTCTTDCSCEKFILAPAIYHILINKYGYYWLGWVVIMFCEYLSVLLLVKQVTERRARIKRVGPVRRVQNYTALLVHVIDVLECVGITIKGNYQ